MAPGYEREQELLKVQREKLTAEIDRSEQVYENIERFLPIIWKYTDITELNAHILNELIERIVVYEKTVNPDGSKSQRVDIHYKFIGYIDTNAWANDRIWIPVGPESDQEQKEAQTA